MTRKSAFIFCSNYGRAYGRVKGSKRSNSLSQTGIKPKWMKSEEVHYSEEKSHENPLKKTLQTFKETKTRW